MALTRDTWVTVLCRKLRDWWHWVTRSLYSFNWWLTVLIGSLYGGWKINLSLAPDCRLQMEIYPLLLLMGEYHVPMDFSNIWISVYLMCQIILIFVRLEVEVYKTLDPGVRVVILKALCDIRVEVVYSLIKIMSYSSWWYLPLSLMFISLGPKILLESVRVMPSLSHSCILVAPTDLYVEILLSSTKPWILIFLGLVHKSFHAIHSIQVLVPCHCSFFFDR